MRLLRSFLREQSEKQETYAEVSICLHLTSLQSIKNNLVLCIFLPMKSFCIFLFSFSGFFGLLQRLCLWKSQTVSLFPVRSFLEVCRKAQMKECNPAGVGGWRGEVSLRLQQRPALSLNFLSIFMPLSFVTLGIDFYSCAHSFYHLHFVSHSGSCTNNDYRRCC